jgi:hypothetical protein
VARLDGKGKQNGVAKQKRWGGGVATWGGMGNDGFGLFADDMVQHCYV